MKNVVFILIAIGAGIYFFSNRNLVPAVVASTKDASGNVIGGYTRPVTVAGVVYNNSFTGVDGTVIYLSLAQMSAAGL